MRYLLSAAIIVFFLTSCQNSGSRKAVPVSDIHEVVVQEVLQVGSYTYLLANEKGMENWLAVPSMIASPGDIYYFKGGLVMNNFESKDLDRTFETVIFLDQIYSTPPSTQIEESVSDSPHTGAVEARKIDFSVDPAENGITIGELYSSKKSYDGQTVIVRGAVIKFNPEIMDKNWIHIQDGTDNDGNFDLTITTGEMTEPGAIITVKGKISLDKDFGYGYFYDLIMEEAEILASE